MWIFVVFLWLLVLWFVFGLSGLLVSTQLPTCFPSALLVDDVDNDHVRLQLTAGKGAVGLSGLFRSGGLFWSAGLFWSTGLVVYWANWSNWSSFGLQGWFWSAGLLWSAGLFWSTGLVAC